MRRQLRYSRTSWFDKEKRKNIVSRKETIYEAIKYVSKILFDFKINLF